MDSFFDTKHLYRSYFKMAFPVVLGLVVTLVYNLADTFFIAQTDDTDLIAGVSLCAPVFTALMAFGNICGQGGSCPRGCPGSGLDISPQRRRPSAGGLCRPDG